MIVIGPGRVILTGFLAMDWVSCHSLNTHGSGSLLEICKMSNLEYSLEDFNIPAIIRSVSCFGYKKIST